MTLAKKILSLGMVAFWAIMTSHCALENIANLDFLACFSEESGSHQAADCHDSDACASVESGMYKSEEGHHSIAQDVSQASFLSVAVLLACLWNLAPVQPDDLFASLKSAPPELAPGWQFSLRTALSPRAPSLLS